MLPFVVRRVLHGVIVVLAASLITFLVMHLAPGGPSLLADPKLSVEERAAITRQLGVDAPLPVQLARWGGRAMRGDLGTSFLYQVPALSAIRSRLPNTLLLAGAALLLATGLGVGGGTLAAARPGGVVDRLGSAVASLGLAVPVFWSGIVLILLLAVKWQLLPAGGLTSDGGGGIADRLRHLLLPAIVLAMAGGAELFRYTRSAVRTTLAEPHLRTARAKGTTRRQQLITHALRPALVTIVSVIGLQLPRLVGGAAITETVFAWPGMGRLGVEAALARDYPLVMAVTVVVSAGVVVASLVVDLLQRWIDPRGVSPT